MGYLTTSKIINQALIVNRQSPPSKINNHVIVIRQSKKRCFG
jgi:hypothetical protein